MLVLRRSFNMLPGQGQFWKLVKDRHCTEEATANIGSDEMRQQIVFDPFE